MQTHSEENYLKTIYLLSKQSNDKVSVTALASALANNPASVIVMLKKLIKKNLIDYDKNIGVRLNETGNKAAVQIIRRHRLWELFLQNKFGYTWDEVHEIAEQMEHVHDEQLADRLDKFLDFPQFDPHGEAIPKANGQMPDIKVKTLQEVQVGKVCKVASVKDTSKSFLQYLYRLNIGIGTTIKVIERIDFDGSLIIMIENSTKATVSEKFIESIFVS